MGELWNIHTNLHSYGSLESDEEKISELEDGSEDIIKKAD